MTGPLVRINTSSLRIMEVRLRAAAVHARLRSVPTATDIVVSRGLFDKAFTLSGIDQAGFGKLGLASTRSPALARLGQGIQKRRLTPSIFASEKKFQVRTSPDGRVYLASDDPASAGAMSTSRLFNPIREGMALIRRLGITDLDMGRLEPLPDHIFGEDPDEILKRRVYGHREWIELFAGLLTSIEQHRTDGEQKLVIREVMNTMISLRMYKDPNEAGENSQAVRDFLEGLKEYAIRIAGEAYFPSLPANSAVPKLAIEILYKICTSAVRYTRSVIALGCIIRDVLTLGQKEKVPEYLRREVNLIADTWIGWTAMGLITYMYGSDTSKAINSLQRAIRLSSTEQSYEARIIKADVQINRLLMAVIKEAQMAATGSVNVD